MVSKTKKFIYIHINKCAGTSIRNFLKPDLLEISNLDSNPWPKDHVTLQELYDIMDTDEFNSFYKFAVIRNPYDRLGSIYNYALHVTNNNGYDVKTEDIPISKKPYSLFNMSTFESFILSLPKHKKICDSSEQTYNTMFSSITEYLSVDGEIKIDRVIPFENLNADLKIIQKKLNLTDKVGDGLPHLNQGDKHLKGSYKNWYTPEMVEIVNNVYEDDIKNFEFKF